MKKLNKIIIGLLCLLFMNISGCKLNSQEHKELGFYDISGNILYGNETKFYEKGILECNFMNYAGKPINKLHVSFDLYDENGLPFARDLVEVTGTILENEKVTFYLEIDKFLDGKDPAKINVSYIYASKIFYEDGTEISDPYGFNYFINQERK